MKFSVLTVLLVLVSFLAQSNEIIGTQTNLKATFLSSNSFNSETDLSIGDRIDQPKNPKKQLNSKRRDRLELGEEIMNTWGDIRIAGPGLAPAAIFVAIAIPFIVVGGSIVIWGALSPKYTKRIN